MAGGIIRSTVPWTTKVGASLPREIATGEVVAIGATDISHIGGSIEITARAAGSVVSFGIVAAILLNGDVIAVDQDKLGIQGFAHSVNGSIEVWFKPLDDGAWAMCVLNRSARPQKFQFDWKRELVVDDLHKREARFERVTYAIRDLWTKKRLGTTRDTLNAEVASHDVLMVRLEKL